MFRSKIQFNGADRAENPQLAALLPEAAGLAVVAADAPASDLASDLASVFPASLLLVPELVAASAGDSATPFFFLPVLKSVSYQPEPLSLKLLADTCFTSVCLPHAGHSTNGGSLIFRNFSSSAPQDSQRYS